jgi:hypothetical protein
MFRFFPEQTSFIIESLKTFIHLYYEFKEAKTNSFKLGSLGSQIH